MADTTEATEKKLIGRWTCEMKGEAESQNLYNTNRYYDMLSGMTPYVELSFRKEGDEWCTINSVDHPYILSIDIEDTGVKTANITLFDKDFGSYQQKKNGLYKGDTNSNDKYSLDQIIKQALKATSEKNNDSTNVKKYTKEEDAPLPEDYLTFVEAADKPVVNLKIRYGYCDFNSLNEGKLKDYFSKKGSQSRSNRWFDFKDNNADEICTATTKFSVKGTNYNSSGKMQLGKITEKNDSRQTSSIYTSVDQTTVISHKREYMILGYNTTFSKEGITYSIKAIESTMGYCNLHRFLQRHAELETNPLEALYILMRMFNETDDQKVKKGSPKILFNGQADDLVMDIDTQGMSDEDIQKFDGLLTTQDISSVTADKLKKIKISFGSDAAARNYTSMNDKPPAYKSVATLMTEFCNACPPKRLTETAEKRTTTDSEGNTVELESQGTKASLAWTVARTTHADNYDYDPDNIYIILYYKVPKKLEHIRKYVWSPSDNFKSVITNLQLQNQNEFAVLSGINSFKVSSATSATFELKNVNAKLCRSELKQNDLIEKMETGSTINTNVVFNETDLSNVYETAYNSCMYVGDMEILGDPSLEFGIALQPWTYPIKLEVLLPKNEVTARMSEKEIESEKSMVMQNYGSFFKHETSRYYVITKIKHSISAAGYKTTLSIASYPNIKKDVLKDEKKEPVEA